jgi:hypothetical protein
MKSEGSTITYAVLAKTTSYKKSETALSRILNTEKLISNIILGPLLALQNAKQVLAEFFYSIIFF